MTVQIRASLEDLDVWQLHALLALGICNHRQWDICEDCRSRILEVIKKKTTQTSPDG